jgi:hypothetical protein
MLKSTQKEFFPLEWYDGKIVRYGNIDASHPSHFLYAVYDCFHDFRKLGQKEKQSYIENQRKVLSQDLDFERWRRSTPIKPTLEHYIQLFQKNLKTRTQYKILERIIESSPSPLFHQIHDDVIHESHLEVFMTHAFQKCLQEIERREKKPIDDVKKQKCCSLFIEFHQIAWEETQQQLFRRYQERCADPLVPIDHPMMIMMLYALPVNVFFIDKDLHNIITIDAEYYIFSTDRQSSHNIFLLYTYPSSFESVGVVEAPCEDSPKHVKIRKQFPHSHTLVQNAIQQT